MGKAVEIFHSEEKDCFQDTARLAGTEEDEEDALHPVVLLTRTRKTNVARFTGFIARPRSKHHLL